MIAVLLAGAVLAAAADPAQPPATVSTLKVPRPEAKPELVCHSEMRPGSHIASRVCLTRAEDAERTARAHELMQDMHNRGESARGPVR